MSTDVSEKGLEGLIVRAITGRVELVEPPLRPHNASTPVARGTGWILGDPKHYDRGASVDLVRSAPAYRNARLNTPQTARIEHDNALAKVMIELLKDDTEVYKQFVQNPSFKRFVTDMVFEMTSEGPLTG